jgi:hypothetical protein
VAVDRLYPFPGTLTSGGQTAGWRFAWAITSAAIDLPIASADRSVLAFAGQMGVNASLGVSAVSG